MVLILKYKKIKPAKFITKILISLTKINKKLIIQKICLFIFFLVFSNRDDEIKKYFIHLTGSLK